MRTGARRLCTGHPAHVERAVACKAGHEDFAPGTQLFLRAHFVGYNFLAVRGWVNGGGGNLGSPG